MKKPILIALLCLVMAFSFSGCKDITDSFKPGSFGGTPQEKAMVEAIAQKYGDLTQRGDPRFLEARMTSNVENQIPVDTVTKYSRNTEKLYAWFVYDNFNEDELEIEWTYLNNAYSIHTFESTTGEDFGRGTFILEQPDDGWANGKYQVVIRGRNIQETIPFEIIDGATVSTPLPFSNGKFNLAASTQAPPVQTTPASIPSPTTPSITPGWYFTHWEYVPSNSDYTLVGTITRGTLFDTSVGEGDKNDFTVSLTRKDAKGNGIASGTCNIKWSDPQTYLATGQKASFTVERSGESFWGIAKMSATIDLDDINPGYGTAGKIEFATPGGEYYLEQYQGTFESIKGMPEGTETVSKRAVILNLGNGYGYKYYYEWRE